MGYVIKVKVRYRDDSSDHYTSLPALFTENGLLISHLRYLVSTKACSSSSWRSRATFSIFLLVNFINANIGKYPKTVELLTAFARALVQGTIQDEELLDESGLYWRPRKLLDARSLLTYITSYTDWLSEQEGYDRERANPFRKATSVEARLNWCAYFHRKANVFLNHLESIDAARDRNNLVRQVKYPSVPTVELEEVKRFPQDRVDDLMIQGFVRKLRVSDGSVELVPDYKNRAIAMLMQYGGIRKSEALHLYFNDIIHDAQRGEAVVRVYHPSDGASPDDNFKTRREYLARCFNLKPRTEYLCTERLHLGWKNPLLTDGKGFFQVHFVPPAKAQEFLFTWACYLKYQRVDAPPEGLHPYAFTNTRGGPESLKNFQRQHADAIRRIGLEPRKELGTTEHAHRHSYGYRIAEVGFSSADIQKSMHHKSPYSHLIYIQSTESDLRAKMKLFYDKTKDRSLS